MATHLPRRQAMNKFLSLAIILFCVGSVSAQITNTAARRVRGGNTPPATCKATAPADIFIDTDATAASRFLVCTSANTWTAQGASSGTTINSTDGRIPYRTSASAFGNSLFSTDATNTTLVSGILFGPFGKLFKGTVNGDVSTAALEIYGDNDKGALSFSNTEGDSRFLFQYSSSTLTVSSPITPITHFVLNRTSGITDFPNGLNSAVYKTVTNCADSAGAAACGSAAAGSVVIDAAATAVVVSTTAVTANSQIMIQTDSSLGTRLSVTCNTQSSLVLGSPRVTARTAGTSFTVTIEAGPTTNPLCLSYTITN